MVSQDMISDEFFACWTRAHGIPHLGGGGHSIAPALVQMAADVQPGESIVDLGPWLGSTTAYLATGVGLGGGVVPIYSYDRWIADWEMSKNAFKQCKVTLQDGERFWSRWAENVIDLPARNVPYMVDVHRDTITPPDEPIGLLVDDCTHTRRGLDAVFSAFGPRLSQGAPVVMLDYYFVETQPDRRELHDVVRWFAKRKPIFDGPYRVPGQRNTAAVFYYQGSWI